MGLKGSKSMLSFLSLPSSVMTSLNTVSAIHKRGRGRRRQYPQNTTSPLGGTRLYNFNLCWVDVMAPKTDSLFTRDLIFDAVPYSSASSFCTRGIWSLGGMMREIMLVPFLNKRLACFSSRALPSGHFKAFDKFLDFPYSNVFICNRLCAHDC